MRRALPVLILIVVAAAVGLAAYRASRPAPPDQPVDRPVHVSRPVTRDNEVVLKPENVAIPKTGDPVENTLKALIATAEDDAKGESAIPKGTHLLSVKVADGTATVDLSEEFLAINTMGNTGESLAQQALRDALAQFPQVEKMRVLVGGQPFEGEHSGEWSDVPVRDNNALTGSDR